MEPRWDRLVADLGARLDAEDCAELDAEVADRVRAERATIGLADRLAGATGPVRLLLAGGRTVDGRVAEVGPDWVLLRPGGGRRTYLARIPAIVEVSGLGSSAPRLRPGVAAPTLASLLRRLSAERARVRVDDIGGRALTGSIRSVYADHVDLAEHPVDAPPRWGEIVRRVTLPVPAIAGVECR